MARETLTINCDRHSSSYPVTIGHEELAGCGQWARETLDTSLVRMTVVSNPTVFQIYGETVIRDLAEAGFTVSLFLMEDGEQYKSFETAESALKSFAESHLTRADAVIALGGGVVGDLAGFASAIYLRGIKFLQIPTTLLAMIDSSVGGKTGVNSAYGKNLIGAFHQPAGVLIDPAVLKTLPVRELTAGLCEIVKHGAISGRPLLKQADDLLSSFPVDTFAENHSNAKFRSGISDLIAANVAFKAEIVAGDEHESSKRVDGKSRKILNFGHTLAHALEKVTDYKYLKHGEAVGYGILFAAELSKTLALCDQKDVNLLNDVVHRAGFLPPLANIDPNEVFEAFKFDKKHIAGSLQMILLKGIGKPVIVTEKDIPHEITQLVLEQLLQKWA